jgi:hypothetical protein
MKKLLLAGVAVLFLAGTAQAGAAGAGGEPDVENVQPWIGRFTAAKWASFCSGAPRTILSPACSALGLVDGFTQWKANSADPINLCVPQETTVMQLVEVGLAYMRNNAGQEDRHVSNMLRDAYKEKWPCIGM